MRNRSKIDRELNGTEEDFRLREVAAVLDFGLVFGGTVQEVGLDQPFVTAGTGRAQQERAWR
jgi:hypothetical protein